MMPDTMTPKQLDPRKEATIMNFINYTGYDYILNTYSLYGGGLFLLIKLQISGAGCENPSGDVENT